MPPAGVCGAAATPSPLGLYVHVPFCRALCAYCNFTRGLFDQALAARYVDALVAEIGAVRDGAPADTVYFGGGTPSMLDADDIARVLRACRDGFDLSPDAEVTLEMNPEDAAPEKLSRLADAGVTRLSMGAQSFHDAELARLGRVHDAQRIVDAVAAARAAGFDNISLDLMMWLPEQTAADWMASVEALIALRPEHASLYLLEIYPNAPLRDAMARARWSQAPDDEAADMYASAFGRLESAGYRHYEISSVARPGFESRHNAKYWTDGDWLAVGCGAHGSRGGRRWRNVTSIAEYVRRVSAGGDPRTEVRTLSADERLADALIMGLRLSAGVDLDRLAHRYGTDVWQRYGDALGPSVDRGLVVHEPPRLRLTAEGRLLANEVLAVFV